MNYKPLFAMLFSISLVSFPVLTQADEPLTESTLLQHITTASSTELVLPPPPPLVNTTPSSTEAGAASTTIPIISSSSTSTPIVTASSPPTSTVVTVETPTSSVTSTMLCLAIIEPAPLQGLEWVAFYGLAPSSTDALLNWTLADAQGTLLKFSRTSALLWDDTSKTIRIELKSSRLNNDGDTVTLKNPLNEKHDEFIYSAVEKGERWMRDSCLSPWHRFPERAIPTPAVTAPDPVSNVTSTSSSVTSLDTIHSSPTGTTATLSADEEPTIVVTSQPLPDVPAPVSEEQTVSDAVNIEPTVEDPPTIFLGVPPAAIVQEEPTLTEVATEEATKHSTDSPKALVTTRTSITKAKTAKKTTEGSNADVTSTSKKATKKSPTKKVMTKKKTAVKNIKTSKPKSTPSLSSLSMSPLLAAPETFQGIRVRVTGRVASEKDILGAHRYVIVNEDGRGLSIHANSKQPSPALGSLIEVTGTVIWNDEGLWLKQTTTDLWQSASSSNQLTYSQLPKRSVSLVSPSQEDAWSLVTTEGVISAVQRSSFDIDVDGIVVRVKVSNKLGYRVARLQAGDQVRVQGLLDARQDDAVLIPQSAEAIEIVKHASIVNPTAKVPVTHPWLPVGAAAGTLGLSESWRRLRDRQKRRREEASFKALVSPNRLKE